MTPDELRQDLGLLRSYGATYGDTLERATELAEEELRLAVSLGR